jgi:hypothetical protein
MKMAMLDAGMTPKQVRQLESILLPKPVDEEAHDDAADILFDRDRS